MTLARILPAVLAVSSTLAFSQVQQQSVQKQSDALPDRTPTITSTQDSPGRAENAPAEPWRIIPNHGPDLDSRNRLDQPPANSFNIDPRIHRFKLDARSEELLLGQEGLYADNTCLSIRSYVVARDSKDSDSTHPVGYSTCQPSNRYQVRSADIRVNTGDR